MCCFGLSDSGGQCPWGFGGFGSKLRGFGVCGCLRRSNLTLSVVLGVQSLGVVGLQIWDWTCAGICVRFRT